MFPCVGKFFRTQFHSEYRYVKWDQNQTHLPKMGQFGLGNTEFKALNIKTFGPSESQYCLDRIDPYLASGLNLSPF